MIVEESELIVNQFMIYAKSKDHVTAICVRPSLKACTKTRNTETKPSERNHRNHRNRRNHRNTGTKPPEPSKHRNETCETTETAIETAKMTMQIARFSEILSLVM